MLRTIRENWLKSRAALLVVEALNRAGAGSVSGNVPLLANRLVEACWSDAPRLYNGAVGPKPNAIGLAVATLAAAADEGGTPVHRLVCVGALHAIMMEVTTNRGEYSINGTDLLLIDVAKQVWAEVLGTDELAKAPPAVNPRQDLEQLGRSIDERLAQARGRRAAS